MNAVAKSARCAAPAFTMIELILVIVIMALLAALAVPSFVGALRGQHLDAAAGGLASACQQARYEALFRGRTCWYVIDFDQQNARLLQEPAGETNAAPTYEDIAAETNILDSATAEVKDTVTMPKGVKMTGVQVQDGSQQNTGKVGFPFYNNGVCEPFRVFLQSEDGEIRAMDVDMFTARAKVFTPM